MKAVHMKKVLSAIVLGASLLAATAVLAHDGAKAKHGGIVVAAIELSFELVTQADGAVIYVDDHGKPLATQGMTGKLTVLKGSEKSEAELKPVGDNKLEARGVKLEAGAKAVAALTTATKKAITVRFTVK
jgi:hypothetical protein